MEGLSWCFALAEGALTLLGWFLVVLRLSNYFTKQSFTSFKVAFYDNV